MTHSVVYVWGGTSDSTSPDCAEFQTCRRIPSVLGKRKIRFGVRCLLLQSVKCHRALHPDGMKKLPIIFLLTTCSVTELLGNILKSILYWSTVLKCKRAAVIPACGETTTEELGLQGNTLPRDLSVELADRRRRRKLQVALRIAAENKQIRGGAYIKALVL